MSSSEPLTLILSPDNPSDTTIIDAKDGTVLYTVVTEHSKSNSVSLSKNTKLISAAGGIIASWKWKDIRSDRLTIGNAAPVSMRTWLRKSMIPFDDAVTFSDAIGRDFNWKGPTLYAKGDKENPIASFIGSLPIPRSELTSGQQESGPHFTPAKLVLEPRAEEILDFVVLSFLVLERRRRLSDKSLEVRVQGNILGSMLMPQQTMMF